MDQLTILECKLNNVVVNSVPQQWGGEKRKGEGGPGTYPHLDLASHPHNDLAHNIKQLIL